MFSMYLTAAVLWAAIIILPVLSVLLLFDLDDPGFWAAFVIWFTIAGALTAIVYVLHQREAGRQQ